MTTTPTALIDQMATMLETNTLPTGLEYDQRNWVWRPSWSCATNVCLAGLAVSLRHGVDEARRLATTGEISEVAADLLGLDRQRAWQLFNETPYLVTNGEGGFIPSPKPTGAEAAQTLRTLLTTGQVRWPPRPEEEG